MPRPDPKTQLATAALKLLAKKQWADLTLAEVARGARLPLSALQPIAPSKPALLAVIVAHCAAETGKRYKPQSKHGDARDRLLDVCLTFFEVLGARKPAIRALHDGLRRDPLALVAAREEITAAANWLLALAEADTGSSAQVRALVLAGIIARAIPIWLEDDQEMTRTMAQLDTDFRRGEWLFPNTTRRRGGKG
jgi:AcrR family transcriptional regulator